MIERILKDIYLSDKEWNVAVLRYFNPIGAHASGLIGEDPNGIPNNLMPYITKVAMGKLPMLHVFGNDYDTHDGTGVRDYIHVVDLAKAHLRALEVIKERRGVDYFNIGTGNGYSVLDIVKAYKEATGIEIKYVIDPRRPGDIAACYADPTKAKEILGWEAEFGIFEMCRDSNNWQEKNPNGYGE
jgi:UDP-glucose 4-epimerase